MFRLIVFRREVWGGREDDGVATAGCGIGKMSIAVWVWLSQSHSVAQSQHVFPGRHCIVAVLSSPTLTMVDEPSPPPEWVENTSPSAFEEHLTERLQVCHIGGYYM